MKVTAKAKRLVESALFSYNCWFVGDQKEEGDGCFNYFPDTTEDCSSEVTKKEWVRFSKDLVLIFADRERILAREKLDNRHINLSQNMR